jgi:hypothetical protein
MNDVDNGNERRLRLAWSIVFVANLPVPPLILASIVTDWGARVGMLVAVLVAITPLYILGLETCRRFRGLGSVIITGGAIVALSQLFPVPHVFAVLWSERICNTWLGDGTLAAGPVVGSVVALLTGAILLLLATVIGLFLNGIILISKMMPVREAAGRPSKLKLWRNRRAFYGRIELKP